MISLDVIDGWLIGGYLVLVLTVGFLARRKGSDATDFLLAGRSLTLPLFVMTLVSTWYGGILGVGEFSYLYGVSNWVVQGFPYYIFAMLFAFLLAGKIRASNLLTIPDKLHQAYDLRTALVGSVLTFVLMTPAPYILMLGILLQLVTGWSLLACILVGTISTTVYLFIGGFRADVYTDVVEFVLMFVGFGVILPFAYVEFGGWTYLVANLPPLHLTWHGGNSTQFIIVWFLIALWTLVDPAFHQRCYAARSSSVARRGILLSIVFWFCFDAMTAAAGLYARAILPPLEQPVMAFPLLAEALLPAGWKAIFYIGMIATIMSSLNTLAFISGTTVGRDIIWRVKKEESDRNVERYTRWGLLLSAVLAVLLALWIPSVIKLWYTIGTVIIPGLLVPLVSSYCDRWKASTSVTFLSMVLGVATSTFWLIIGWSDGLGVSSHYPWGIEPMFPGLIVSLCIWGWGIVKRSSG